MTTETKQPDLTKLVALHDGLESEITELKAQIEKATASAKEKRKLLLDTRKAIREAMSKYSLRQTAPRKPKAVKAAKSEAKAA